LSLHFGIYISPFVCFGCEETQTTAQSSVSQYNFTILGGSNSPSTMTHHHLDEYGQNRHHRSNSNVSSSTSSCVVQWPANEHVFLPIEFDRHEDSETSVDESSHTGNNELRSDNNNDPTSRRETPNCNSTSNPIVGGSGGSRDDNQRIHVSIEVLHSRTLFSYHVSLGYAVLPIDCQFMERNRGKIVGVPLRREREVIAILSLKIDDHYSIFSSDVRGGVSSSKDDKSISNLVGKDNSSDSDDEYMEASGTQELDQSSTMHRIHERDSMMSLCSQHSDQLPTESREEILLPEPMKDHNSEHFDHRESSMEESISLGQSIADSQDKSEMSFEERFKIKKLIGKGGMGSVFRAFDKHNNIDVAIKKIYCKSSEQVNRAMREVWPIRTLEHENLVSCNEIYFEDCVDRKGKQFAVCLVMELFSKGDLHRHINKRLENKDYIPQVDLLLMMKQLASGLLYLHDRSLLHRDLKPMNIFISDRGTLKIGDFGMVKDVHKALARTTAGTQKFMAPEIFLREPYSLKADVWSLGVTYLEMMALKVDMLPYLEIYRNKSFHGDLEADLLTLKLYDREVVNIILQCLTLDPTNRPSVSQILVYISKLLGEETEQQMEEKPMLYKSTSSIISKTLSTIESIERRFGDMDTMMKDLTEYLSMDQFRKRRASSSSQSSPDASDRVDMGDETPPSGDTEERKHRRTGSLGDMFTSFFRILDPLTCQLSFGFVPCFWCLTANLMFRWHPRHSPDDSILRAFFW